MNRASIPNSGRRISIGSGGMTNWDFSSRFSTASVRQIGTSVVGSLQVRFGSYFYRDNGREGKVRAVCSDKSVVNVESGRFA